MNDARPIKSSKFAAYRARKRAAGLREVRMWVPDLTNPVVQAKVARQAKLLYRTPDERQAAHDMQALTDEVWSEIP